MSPKGTMIEMIINMFSQKESTLVIFEYIHVAIHVENNKASHDTTIPLFILNDLEKD